MAELKRSLGLFECTVMGVGVILGAGIYALVGKAAALGGNLVWASFIGAATVAAFTGLSYAELAGLIPKAGGEYYYARRAFGDVVAFLVSWTLLAGLAVASGAVALGFGGYLSALTGLNPVLGTTLILACSALLLSWGIRETVWAAAGATALEVVGLIAVVCVGAPHLGEVNLLEAGPEGLRGVSSAAALIFFAYIGFEEIVQLAEETRDPTRNVPRALVLSIVITTALYVAVALAAVSVVGYERLGSSQSPLVEVFSEVGWNAGAVISIIALFSTGNTVLILLLSASRLLYGMADDGALPGVLGHVGSWRRTPWVATVAVGSMAVAVALWFEDIERVASLTNLAIFATFLVINAAVIRLRFSEPELPRPFRVPLTLGRVPLLPVAGIVTTLFLMGQVGLFTFAWGAGLAAVGLVVWAAMRARARNAG